MNRVLILSFVFACAFALPSLNRLNLEAAGSYRAVGPGLTGHYLTNGTVQKNSPFNATFAIDTVNKRIYIDNSVFGKRWIYEDRAYTSILALGGGINCFQIETNYTETLKELSDLLEHDLVLSFDQLALGQIAPVKQYQTLAQTAFECHLPTSYFMDIDSWTNKLRRWSYYQVIDSPFSGVVKAFVHVMYKDFYSLTEDDDPLFETLPASCSTPVSNEDFRENYYHLDMLE